MERIELKQYKYYALYFLLSMMIGAISNNYNISIILLYIMALMIVFKGLKSNFLKTWAYVIIFIFTQFFVVDYVLPYVFNLKNYVVSLLKLWKEIVILESLIVLYSEKVNIRRIVSVFKKEKVFKVLFLSTSLYILTMIIYTLKSKSIFVAVYGLRIYLLPYVITILFFVKKFKKDEISEFLDIIAKGFSYLSLWGIFQAVVLGDKFLLALGYGDGIRLSNSYYLSGYFGRQRVAATFASPNTFAVIASFFILYYICKIYNNKKNLKTKDTIYLAIIFIALILSYSRSAYVALAIGIVWFAFNELSKKQKIYFSATILGLSTVMIILSFIFVDKIDNMFINHIFRTVTLKDTSVVGHIDSIVYGINKMSENIWGVGLGMSGPKAMQFVKNALHVENSYLIVGFDLGIIGLILYIINVAAIGYTILWARMKENSRNNYIFNLLFANYMGIYFTAMLLPIIQELEVFFVFSAILGLVINQYIYASENEEY